MVPDDRIHAVLSSGGNPDETADGLVASAIDQGGPDTITVIIIDVPGSPDRPLDGAGPPQAGAGSPQGGTGRGKAGAGTSGGSPHVRRRPS